MNHGLWIWIYCLPFNLYKVKLLSTRPARHSKHNKHMPQGFENPKHVCPSVKNEWKWQDTYAIYLAKL